MILEDQARFCMKYRYFEDAKGGTEGVWIAVENRLIFPVKYGDIQDENGNLLFEGKMQGGTLDNQCGEGFYLEDKIVIPTGSVAVTSYFEITDDFYRPYLDGKLSIGLPPGMDDVPLRIIIHDYPGLIQIEPQILRAEHIRRPIDKQLNIFDHS